MHCFWFIKDIRDGMWSSDKKYIIVTAIICSSGNFMFWSPFVCFWSPVQLLSRFLLYKSKIFEIKRDILTRESSSWPPSIVSVEKVVLSDQNLHTFPQNLDRTMWIWSGIWIPAQFSQHIASLHAGKASLPSVQIVFIKCAMEKPTKNVSECFCDFASNISCINVREWADGFL